MPGQGYVSRGQIFLEADASWGTRVITNGSVLEFDDYGIDLDQAFIESRSFHSQLTARALHQMGIKASGSIGGEWRYEGMAKLIAAAMGKRGTFATVNATVRRGTYKIDKTVQGGTPSISLEVDEGGVYKSSGDCAVVLGMVIPRMRWRVNAGIGDDAMLRYEADVLAKDLTPQTTAQFTAGLPAANVDPVFFHHSVDASFSDGSGDAVAGVNVVGVEIEVVNPLAERYFIAPAGKNIVAPIRNGRVQVFWTIRKEFTSWAIYDAAKAFTDAASGGMNLKIASPTIIAASSPSTPYSIEFSSPKAKCIAPGKGRINEWGIIEQTARWQVYHDATETGLQIVIDQLKTNEDTAGG